MGTYNQLLNLVEEYNIIGATAKDQHNVYILFEIKYYGGDKPEDDYEDVCLVHIKEIEDDIDWGWIAYGNVRKMFGYANHKMSAFVSDHGFVVAEYTQDANNFVPIAEVPLPPKEQIRAITSIDNTIYVCGTGRFVAKFENGDAWVDLSAGYKAHEDDIFLATTFEVIDGFSAEWWFSWGVFAANSPGSILLVGQGFFCRRHGITFEFFFLYVSLILLDFYVVTLVCSFLFGSPFLLEVLQVWQE